MKKTFLLSTFLFITNLVFSQGINFEPNIEAAFQKAKTLGKPVFVECYHPTCPICSALEPTLKNAEVSKFYNQNFVNYKLNLSDIKQVAFLNRKKIHLPSFPLFIFFDANEEILHHSDAVNTPEGLIQHAKDALNPATQTGAAWKKYQAGDRDINMMMGLAYLLRIKQDTTKNIQVANDLYAAFPKDQMSSKISWIIAKKYIMDIENGFADYWLNNISIAQGYSIEEGHEGAEKNSLGMLVQMAIYDPKASQYSLEKVKKLQKYMVTVGAGQYISGATWHIECPAILREQGQDQAFTFLKNLINDQTPPQLLIYYTSFFTTNFPDGKYADAARQWLIKAKPQLKAEQDIANLNYESARLYQKKGDLVNAKKDITLAKTSIAIAKVKVTDPNLKKVVLIIEDAINKLAGELK
jgi:thiol-disulfide isomerase/thioredoxin